MAPQSVSNPEESLEIDMRAVHGAQAARFKGRLANSLTETEMTKLLRVAGEIEVPSWAVKQEPVEGKGAPSFRAITFDGKMVDLQAMRGKKIWLIFYRYATCPLCNLHLRSIGQRYAALKKGNVEVVAVFDSAVPQFYYPGGFQAPLFPLIADPKKTLYALYQTKKGTSWLFSPSVLFGFIRSLLLGFKQGKVLGEFGQLPSHYLIDESGAVKAIYHGKTPVDHISWAKLGLFAKISKAELLA